MKIDTLEIVNFRLIKQLTLHFKPGINVIAGINGAGKSTLLYAIEILLSWVKARIRLRNSNGIYPSFADVSHGQNITRLGVIMSEPKEMRWDVTRVSPYYRGKDRHKSELSQLTEYTDTLVNIFNNNGGKTNLPMFVKYSVNRSLIDIPTHVRKKHILDAMSLYEGKIESGGNLRSFYEWFREREDIEREEREERHTFEYDDSQLNAVRRAISTVMEGYGDLHTRRKAPSGFELRKNGEVFRVEDLSDGEKCYLTLIGDVARRLAICNPLLLNPLEGVGIVLIDELELHLHPLWQCQAIDKLRSVFPNCQFFITTHSPHIVQNLRLNKEDSLTVLSRGEIFNVDAEYGATVDKTLSEIFGLQSLRPIPVTQALERVWNILERGVFEGDVLSKAVDDLKDLIQEPDLEFVKIQMQIALNKEDHKDA